MKKAEKERVVKYTAFKKLLNELPLKLVLEAVSSHVEALRDEKEDEVEQLDEVVESLQHIQIE